MLHVVRRDPKAFGIEGTRWTLEKIHQVCDWLKVSSGAGISHLLDRLGIVWKRAREHVHSPDPAYISKLCTINVLVSTARVSGKALVTLYMDELTYYRQPTVANNYEARGHHQPYAERSHQSNTQTRIVATLDVLDGRVIYRQASHITLTELVAFYQQLREAYPRAERLFVVQDNWPDHFHPDVLVALEEQESPWPWHLPNNWPKEPSRAAEQKWGGLNLPIQLVPLPTYASWANPIEKLWRWTKQELLHLHRLADKLPELRHEVRDSLDKFANGSNDLLRYTGLRVPG